MKKILFTFFAAMLFLPNLAQAATFQTGEEVFVDHRTADDLYATGGVLSVAREVSGDLIAVGGKVNVQGKISQDLFAGGGDITIDGEVDDDARLLGGSVRIDATIKDDLIAAGGDVSLADSSFVGGDVDLAGGSLILGGAVNGDMKLAAGSIHFNSDVKGNVTLVNFEKITFGPNARIQGSLSYRAPQAIEVPPNVARGGVIFEAIETDRVTENLPAVLAGFSLLSFLATLFFGLVLLWLFRHYLLHAAEIAYENTLKTVGVGFLVLILTPIMALILLVTTIGLPLSLCLLTLWLVFLYTAKVMAAMLIGFKLVRVSPKSRLIRLFGSFTLGALIYSLIGMVPVIGWVINLIFVMTALGGMTLYELELFEQLRKKKIL